MAKKYRYIVRVTVVSEEKIKKSDIKDVIQLALDDVVPNYGGRLTAKAGVVDIQ